jgi:hypothetical protein
MTSPALRLTLALLAGLAAGVLLADGVARGPGARARRGGARGPGRARAGLLARGAAVTVGIWQVVLGGELGACRPDVAHLLRQRGDVRWARVYRVLWRRGGPCGLVRRGGR